MAAAERKKGMDYHGYPVEVTLRGNARRMKLSARRGDTCFRLTVPRWAKQEEVTAFLRENERFMQAHAAELTLWAPEYAAGERHLLLGAWVTLGEGGGPTGITFIRLRQASLEKLIRELLPGWMARMNVSPARITFRRMRSRWGSCATKTGVITLAVNLGLLPPRLVEYVLVHELCHLHHPDHSPAFHAELGRHLPDAAQREKELKQMDIAPKPKTR